MLDCAEVFERAKRFNNINVGDRIVYSHRNKTDKINVRSRRDIAKNDKTVTVLENDNKVRVRWDKIIMA